MIRSILNPEFYKAHVKLKSGEDQTYEQTFQIRHLLRHPHSNRKRIHQANGDNIQNIHFLENS